MRIIATAQRWEHGWELSINGEVVTQVTTLDTAEQQVRNYLDTIKPEVDHTDWEVVIEPELGELGQRIIAAKLATVNAQRLQEAAAQDARAVVRDLRSAGISVTDTAAILGISRGRVSQLASR